MPRIALAQIPLCLTDFSTRLVMIEHAIECALSQDADLLVLPELALHGYLAKDFLLSNAYAVKVNAQFEQFVELTRQQAWSIPILLGHFSFPNIQNTNHKKNSPLLYNAASLIHQGICLGTHHKQHLPVDGVFDERRYFLAPSLGMQTIFSDKTSYTRQNFIDKNKETHQFAWIICEDMWHPPVMQTPVDILCVLNASPFEIGKHNQRLNKAKAHLSYAKRLVYVNGVNAMDEWVFDGQSFVLGQDGLLFQAPAFKEGVYVIDTHHTISVAGFHHPSFTQDINLEQLERLDHADQINQQNDENFSLLSHLSRDINHSCYLNTKSLADVYAAMICATRAYFEACGFKKAVLGLSGGIDSAVVACIAREALGEKNVHAMMMPTRYTADMSQIDAQTLAENLNISYQNIAIESHFNAYQTQLNQAFGEALNAITQQNLQARVRGQILMAYSNQYQALVLTTGNKSELAMGYCTLYGDMAGGFAPIKDLYKTQVYALAEWINRSKMKEIIPERIITRAPSAELAPEQKDEDNLPPYPLLDEILYQYIEQKISESEILNALSEQETWKMMAFNDLENITKRVLRTLHQQEYKRQQAPLGPKLQKCSFGADWRYPMSLGQHIS